MDISNWPLGRIMQLPDFCFGRRWPAICGKMVPIGADNYVIVGPGVPDQCVIWEILVTSEAALSQRVIFELAWADQLVTTAAQWSALQKMFPCQGVQDGLDMNLICCGQGPLHLINLRLPSPASGLRPAVRFDGDTTDNVLAVVTFVISSLPKEVPDWLLSGQARSP